MTDQRQAECREVFERWKKSLPVGQGYSAFDAWKGRGEHEAAKAQPDIQAVREALVEELPTEAIIAALEASLRFRKERGLDDVQPDSPGGIPSEMVRVVYRAMRPYLLNTSPAPAQDVVEHNTDWLAHVERVAKDDNWHEHLETISKLGDCQPMKFSIPQQSTRKLNQAQVIERVLVVPDQDRPTLREPRMRPFHYPTSRLVLFFPRGTAFSSPIRRMCGV